MSKIKAVIFDIDNTLYSYAPCDKAGTEAMKKYLEGLSAGSSLSFEDNLAASKKRVKSFNGNTAASHNRMLYSQRMCENLGITGAEAVLGLYNSYWDAYLGAMKLRQGVKEVFEFLKKHNIKTGFCTDLTANIQFRKIVRLGISDFPDAIVTSEECGAEKPSPVIFGCILEKLNVLPSEAVMVGDDFSKDVQGALRCGMKAVYIGGDKTAENCFCAADLEEAHEILKGLL